MDRNSVPKYSHVGYFSFPASKPCSTSGSRWESMLLAKQLATFWFPTTVRASSNGLSVSLQTNQDVCRQRITSKWHVVTPFIFHKVDISITNCRRFQKEQSWPMPPRAPETNELKSVAVRADTSVAETPHQLYLFTLYCTHWPSLRLLYPSS